ncbi:MAG: ABC transporter permease, partial [Clostridia bacterium]|nr:ABC transporter permease [Clostridia bacterium]
MTISLKDAVKFFGISIIVCCAAFVCNMFLNYDVDLRSVEPPVEAGALYDALIMNDIVVCAVSGGCLILTSVVMLIFYIGQYIEANSPKFGVLKALGYGNFRISLPCALFGLSVFLGAVVGVGLSWTIIPSFYDAQNANNAFIEIPLRYHASITVLLIVVPTVIFGVLSVLIALFKLKIPALSLIRGNVRKEKA